MDTGRILFRHGFQSRPSRSALRRPSDFEYENSFANNGDASINVDGSAYYLYSETAPQNIADYYSDANIVINFVSPWISYTRVQSLIVEQVINSIAIDQCRCLLPIEGPIIEFGLAPLNTDSPR